MFLIFVILFSGIPLLLAMLGTSAHSLFFPSCVKGKVSNLFILIPKGCHFLLYWVVVSVVDRSVRAGFLPVYPNFQFVLFPIYGHV